MPCGRKHYLKLKERKKYKDIILLLATDDGRFWTYNDDAEKLAAALQMECSTNYCGEASINPTEEAITSCFKLKHLGGNAYQAISPDSVDSITNSSDSIIEKLNAFISLLSINTRKPKEKPPTEPAQPEKQSVHRFSKAEPIEESTETEFNYKLQHVDQVLEKSCDNCQLRKGGTCSNLRNQLCSDYRAIPYISREERDGWPSMGDASRIAQRIPWNKR